MHEFTPLAELTTEQLLAHRRRLARLADQSRPTRPTQRQVWSTRLHRLADRLES